MGRFAQADSIIPVESQGTQAWDRYAGMNNNPVRYSDPSGHRACDDLGCDGEIRYKKRTSPPPPPQPPQPLQPNSSNQACTGSNPSVVCRPQNFDDNQPGNNFDPNLQFYTGPKIQSWPPYGYYVAGYESVIDLSLIDWFHLVTNGAGIVGDGATIVALLAPPTAPVSGTVAVVGNVIDWIGVGADVYDLMVNNDPSGLAVDGVEHLLSKATGKSIPILGLGLNLEGFFSAVEVGRVTKPILRPHPVYTLPGQ